MECDEIFDKIEQAFDTHPKPYVEDCCPHSEVATTDGTELCLSCGLEISHFPVYVRSYNRVFSFRRQPIYSRQKRFYQYLISLCNDEVARHMEDILCLFAKIEFHWNIFGNPTRKYFFNRNVTFFFIAGYLDLAITPKTLKDETRVLEQLVDIKKLVERNSFFNTNVTRRGEITEKTP